ncbi:MAG: NifU family protein [Planctomycetota bacterium]|jgi:Fe-S cluster biogenesis protein NfuA
MGLTNSDAADSTGPDLPPSVQEILEAIRPAIQADGGDIEAVRFEEGVLTLRFLGACVGCPSAEITLRQFIERAFDAVPEVTGVVAAPS